MKITYRIPTETYAFTEIVEEGDFTPEEISARYGELSRAFKPQEGLPPKEWNEALDRYISDGTGETEVYQKMSDQQKEIMQEIKRAVKRIKYKNEHI